MIGRKPLRVVALVLGLVLVSSVAVYAAVQYNQVKTLDNVMSTKTSAVNMQEIFNPNDKWFPGETKQKEVRFGNTGETDQVMRYKYEATWTDEATGEVFPATISDVTIGWCNTDQWTLIGDWYYYKSILEPGEVTDLVMESVTFSPELSNGSYTDATDYSNKSYTLTITMEALPVDSDVTAATWGVTFTQSDSSISWSKAPSNT